MPKQIFFAQAEYDAKRKTTRRDRYPEGDGDRGTVVAAAGTVASSSLSRGGQGSRPPIGLELMLRLYFLQQWFGLADEALEDAVYDS